MLAFRTVRSSLNLHFQQTRLFGPPLPCSYTSHDSQLPKPFQNVLVHPSQPLLLEQLLAAHSLHNALNMLPHKRNEVDTVHWIRVDELALANVLWGFGFGGVIGFWRPEEGAGVVC